MRQRCENPKHKSYPLYGGRGIKVCRRWKQSFEAFFADMGDRPSPKMTIDRKNNNKGYSKSNCRWATYSEQRKNVRRGYFSDNVSGYAGVYPARGKWEAAVYVNNAKVHIGTFSRKEDAVIARMDFLRAHSYTTTTSNATNAVATHLAYVLPRAHSR